MHICIYIYIYIYLWTHIHMYIFLYIYMLISVLVCISVFISIFISQYVRLYMSILSENSEFHMLVLVRNGRLCSKLAVRFGRWDSTRALVRSMQGACLPRVDGSTVQQPKQGTHSLRFQGQNARKPNHELCPRAAGWNADLFCPTTSPLPRKVQSLALQPGETIPPQGLWEAIAESR